MHLRTRRRLHARPTGNLERGLFAAICAVAVLAIPVPAFAQVQWKMATEYPENNISVDEAMQLFGMASALISLMAEQIDGLQDHPKADRQENGKGGKAPSAASALSLGDDDEIYDYPLSQVG